MNEIKEITGDPAFFMDELREMQEGNDRRYNSLSRRVAQLEERVYDGGSSFGEDNPFRPILGIMVIGMAFQLLAPVIEALVKKWCSQSSES